MAGIVGRAASDDDTDSDVEIPRARPSARNKGKRKAGEKLEWSDEDDENPYEAFKNRKTAKRKKLAANKKILKKKTKDALENRKKSKENGEPSKRRNWGDVTDDEMVMDEDIPEYLVERRREFDRKRQVLKEAGLKLPPRYDDIDFSDDERIADLDERPDFRARGLEPSRKYEDIELPHSLGLIPSSIAQYLRDYQVEGVAFLHELFVYQKGGILGDDMGLGKTVQVAAFLTAAFGKTGDERDAKRMRKMRRAPSKPWYPRILVICPGSLMQNWKNELEVWGWWHADIYHGLGRKAVLEAANSGRLEVVITTYNTYRLNSSEINLIQWDCVVADECHIIKEKSSAVTQAMNQVNALCRIGLTGTAIQNRYEELWTLLNWTNPGRFGPVSTWESSISKPLKTGQSHDATYSQLKIARQTAKALANNLLPEFFLRRMKSLIAHQLPKKSDRVVFCPLTGIQKEAYERYLESDVIEYIKTSTDDCDCGSEHKRGWCCYKLLPDSNTKWQSMVFPAIITLQKLSNHLALLLPNSEDNPDKRDRDLEILKTIVPEQWEELYESRGSLKTLSNPDFCGKWGVLRKLLKYWHEEGDKVLIFSHSVKLLRLLEHLFHMSSYNVSFLSGSIAPEDRQKEVDNFNSDPSQFVFLISTKAGGVGLNITSANKVVIFDPNWNPSYDLQAQDRAYRIGQTRNVEVFRLVSAGTVEEIVYARQIYKQQQANIGYNASTERRYFKGVQNKADQKGEIFGLHNLLTFHGEDIVLRDIVNKTNVAEAKRGVDVLEFDMDAVNDDDDILRVDDDAGEDAVMSQLAALLTEGDDEKKKPKSRPKADAVQAILAAAGVQYTHENSEVVGSSRVEAELSRRAEEAGNDVDYGEERLFAESQHGSSDPAKIRYEFHPPEDVMSRQFCTMAKMFGFASATEFAFAVEGMTQKQRTNTLEKFYQKRREALLDIEMQDGGVRDVQDPTAYSDVDTSHDIEEDISDFLGIDKDLPTIPEDDEVTGTDEDDEL